MSMFNVAAAAVLLISGVGAAQSPAVKDVVMLGWLSGTWTVENGDEWIEERWSAPRGGLMVGNSMTGRGNKATGFEYFRITADDKGAIHYMTQPGGQPVVAFKLSSASANEVVFENPKHDFPTRILYRRAGKILVATISGPGGSNPISWRYKRKN